MDRFSIPVGRLAEPPLSSPYLDRLLCAAMKRRALETLALRALMKATHLLGLALAERPRQYRDSGDSCLDRFAQLREEALHAALLGEATDILVVPRQVVELGGCGGVTRSSPTRC
jgi:hypothetical protein